MKSLVIVLVSLVMSSVVYAGNGLVKVKSSLSVSETINTLEKRLKSKGMTIFSRVKHHEGAKKVGLDIRETELLIFGNPKLGTKLIECNQASAIDLPLKFLSWKDSKNQVWVGYNSPRYLSKRYKIKKCAKLPFQKMSKALKAFTAGL